MLHPYNFFSFFCQKGFATRNSNAITPPDIEVLTPDTNYLQEHTGGETKEVKLKR